MKQMLAMLGAGIALGLALMSVPAAAQSAGPDCNARRRTATQATICDDAQLHRTDQQLARRVGALARQLSYGQYLGLRYWRYSSVEDRNRCGADRGCVVAGFRAQMRFLDRLQLCLDTSPRRRGCLRDTLNLDREALRR